MSTHSSQNQSNSNMTIKIFQLFSFAILFLMVAVQFNDPDPIFWIAFYGACALVPAAAFFQLNNKLLFYVCLVFCLIALAMSFQGALEYTHHLDESILQSMSADKPYLEETREFFGALIALLLISAHQFIISRQQPK